MEESLDLRKPDYVLEDMNEAMKPDNFKYLMEIANSIGINTMSELEDFLIREVPEYDGTIDEDTVNYLIQYKKELGPDFKLKEDASAKDHVGSILDDVFDMAPGSYKQLASTPEAEKTPEEKAATRSRVETGLKDVFGDDNDATPVSTTTPEAEKSPEELAAIRSRVSTQLKDVFDESVEEDNVKFKAMSQADMQKLVDEVEEDDMTDLELAERLDKALREGSDHEKGNDRKCCEVDPESSVVDPDNAVVDCKKYTVVAHCEDEAPVDCDMKKPPLEKPLTEEIETPTGRMTTCLNGINNKIAQLVDEIKFAEGKLKKDFEKDSELETKFQKVLNSMIVDIIGIDAARSVEPSEDLEISEPTDVEESLTEDLTLDEGIGDVFKNVGAWFSGNKMAKASEDAFKEFEIYENGKKLELDNTISKNNFKDIQKKAQQYSTGTNNLVQITAKTKSGEKLDLISFRNGKIEQNRTKTALERAEATLGLGVSASGNTASEEAATANNAEAAKEKELCQKYVKALEAAGVQIEPDKEDNLKALKQLYKKHITNAGKTTQPRKNNSVQVFSNEGAIKIFKQLFPGAEINSVDDITDMFKASMDQYNQEWFKKVFAALSKHQKEHPEAEDTVNIVIDAIGDAAENVGGVGGQQLQMTLNNALQIAAPKTTPTDEVSEDETPSENSDASTDDIENPDEQPVATTLTNRQFKDTLQKGLMQIFTKNKVKNASKQLNDLYKELGIHVNFERPILKQTKNLQNSWTINTNGYSLLEDIDPLDIDF